MAGKSVLIKQTALIALMAHAGSFVPAQTARIGLIDRIFTRVGASDELTRGHSTFMVEMTEAANILNNATTKSLVILDEIGRGTSTYDGVSLAWAITEHLHDVVGCRAMFATHYHELAQLAESLKHLQLQRASSRDGLRRDLLAQIAPGKCRRSYGIHVAKLAGVPVVLERATGILAELETRHQPPKLSDGQSSIRRRNRGRSRRRNRADALRSDRAHERVAMTILDQFRLTGKSSSSQAAAGDLAGQWFSPARKPVPMSQSSARRPA